MNIANNLKAIEDVKGEILTEIADLYKMLSDYDELADYESVENSLATIVIMDYILAKHLGIAYNTLDVRVNELLNMALENGHSLETEFRDISELIRYLRKH